MLKLTIGVIFGLLLVAIGWVVASFFTFSRMIENEVAALKAAARPNDEVVSEERMARLPEPVQRHLRQAGVVGQKIPTLVTLTQTGRIRGKPDANWMDFTATETYSTNPPGFVWRAAFPSASLPIVFGRDHYLAGDGRITMKMLGTLNVADIGGGEINAAALMRYLNEMMWFPAALAGSNLTYTPVDETSADVTLTDGALSVTARLFFDAEGRLVNFVAPRFETNSNAELTWETPINAYGTLAGMNLPTQGKAVWQTPEGPFAYIEATVTGITLDQD